MGNSKARDISACMKMLQEEYAGRVPDDFDALLKLPGVGRKSANLRISGRIATADQKTDSVITRHSSGHT